MTNLIAQFGGSEEWMAIVLGGLMLLIPLIAILTRHQQKMAEILRDRTGASNPDEIAALRAEVARLTQAVHQQTILLDGLTRQGLSSQAVAQSLPDTQHMRPPVP